MKYLVMICRGHVPPVGQQPDSEPGQPDVKPFGRSPRSVKHFHLAFKNMDAAEIYDVLMEQFLRAVKKYGPAYTEKGKIVAEEREEGNTGSRGFNARNYGRRPPPSSRAARSDSHTIFRPGSATTYNNGSTSPCPSSNPTKASTRSTSPTRQTGSIGVLKRFREGVTCA
jgi:hypothetical protein